MFISEEEVNMARAKAIHIQRLERELIHTKFRDWEAIIDKDVKETLDAVEYDLETGERYSEVVDAEDIYNDTLAKIVAIDARIICNTYKEELAKGMNSLQIIQRLTKERVDKAMLLSSFLIRKVPRPKLLIGMNEDKMRSWGAV